MRVLGCPGAVFLVPPQPSSRLHRLCTGLWPLTLAGIERLGAKSDDKVFSKKGFRRLNVIRTAAEVCPLCEGTGWKTLPAVPSAPRDRRVTRCDCQLRARNQTLLAAARIPARYEHCELRTFEFDGLHRSLAPARMAACKFVEEYPVDKTGLLLIGTIGVGKTHLAVGIIKELILSKGIACLFYDYRELLKQIQNSYNDTVKTTELDVLRPVFETEVLALDELGAVKPTDWVWDTVSLILNTRYNDNRTTIITTNYPNLAERQRLGNVSSRSSEAAKYAAERETLGDRIGDRMRSRLHEMCRIVTMEGTDFRQQVKSASFR
ncbi:MAG: ATP-binding protein [Candidatus Sulfotelmatobacter sp.]